MRVRWLTPLPMEWQWQLIMRLRERWLTLMPMEWQRQLIMRLRERCLKQTIQLSDRWSAVAQRIINEQVHFFSCSASEIASNDVAYAAAAEEAALARGEAMTVQAETAVRGAEHKFLHTLRSSPGSGWTMSSHGWDWTLPRTSEGHRNHGRYNSTSQKWLQQCHYILPAIPSNRTSNCRHHIAR